MNTVKSLQNLFFFNREKSRTAQTTFRNITKNEKSFICHKRINQELFDFYKNLFSKNLNACKNDIMQFLICVPQSIEDQSRD